MPRLTVNCCFTLPSHGADRGTAWLIVPVVQQGITEARDKGELAQPLQLRVQHWATPWAVAGSIFGII